MCSSVWWHKIVNSRDSVSHRFFTNMKSTAAARRRRQKWDRKADSTLHTHTHTRARAHVQQYAISTTLHAMAADIFAQINWHQSLIFCSFFVFALKSNYPPFCPTQFLHRQLNAVWPMHPTWNIWPMNQCYIMSSAHALACCQCRSPVCRSGIPRQIICVIGPLNSTRTGVS